MSKATVCPHFLINYQLSTPSEIEKHIIGPLYQCLKKCIESNVKIVMPKQVMEEFQNTFPWNLLTEINWKGYLATWHELIRKNLIDHAHIQNVEITTDINTEICEKLQEELSVVFFNFLTVFSGRSLPGGLSEEGIISSENCSGSISYSNCHAIRQPSDVEKIKFPWLRIYNKPLPTGGDYPFSPPANWRTNKSPIKGEGYGFLDCNGIEWRWDKLHDDHWDVQDGTPYTNVSPNGKILN